MDYPLEEYSMGDHLHRVLLLERTGCAVKHAVCINRQLLLRALCQREHACCCDNRSEQAGSLQVGAALRQCIRRGVCDAHSVWQLDHLQLWATVSQGSDRRVRDAIPAATAERAEQRAVLAKSNQGRVLDHG